MVLSCQNISKEFGDNEILSGVSFQMEKNEKYAIVGSNGCGKSTLLKIIVGSINEYSGDVVIANQTSIGYLAQYTEVSDNESILDFVISSCDNLIKMEDDLNKLGVSMAEFSSDTDKLNDVVTRFNKLQEEFNSLGGLTFRSKAEGILKGLGFCEEEFSKNLDMLSGGEKTRVCLAKLLLSNPNLLILDEPINHLDIKSIAWLEGFLQNYAGAILLVAHDRYFLDKIVDHVIDLNGRRAKTYKGNYTEYLNQKELLEISELNAYNKQQKEIEHQKEVIEKLKSYNREKFVKRAESREKVLEKMDVLDNPVTKDFSMKLKFYPSRLSGNDVLAVKNLSCKYDDDVIFEDISFSVNRGEKIAILGENGTGKTTILKMICDKIKPSSGEISYGSNLDLGYYDQAQMNLCDEKNLFEEISDTYPDFDNTKIRNTLAAFGFCADDVFKKISMLSGGERGRLSLAKLMLSNANFLCLDEPTNHLDMESKEILENAINDFEGTVLFVSHDRYFINKCADRILELNENIGLKEYLGNYDYYLFKKSETESESYTGINDEKSDAQISWEEEKKQRAALRKQQNRIKQIEDEISKCEEQIADLDKQLADDSNASNSAKLNELFSERNSIEEKLNILMEEWESTVDL